jgi:hypothetical protein
VILFENKSLRVSATACATINILECLLIVFLLVDGIVQLLTSHAY